MLISLVLRCDCENPCVVSTCQPQDAVTLITGRFLSLRRLAATVSRKVPVGVEVDQGTFMPDFSRLHTQILRVRYSEIQARSCWHCVRLLHRIMFATRCSEAIAESAGSTLRFIEKKGSAGRSVKAQGAHFAGGSDAQVSWGNWQPVDHPVPQSCHCRTLGR